MRATCSGSTSWATGRWWIVEATRREERSTWDKSKNGKMEEHGDEREEWGGHLLDGVDAVLDERIEEGAIEAVSGGDDDVEGGEFDGENTGASESI